jgi:hypothetical protein
MRDHVPWILIEFPIGSSGLDLDVENVIAMGLIQIFIPMMLK